MGRILLVVVVGLIVTITLLFMFSATPEVDLPHSITAIGQSTPIVVQVKASHGIRRIAASIDQNGVRYSAFDKVQSGRRIFWQRGVADASWNFTVGTQIIPQLKDGKARLVIEATSNDFRGKTARVDREVTVITRPPTLTVDSEQHYLYRGMAELVTFVVSGYWTEAGVRVGEQTFRSWPMPDGKPGLLSLFVFSWDLPADTVPLVYATNPAANEVIRQIAVQFPKREQPVYRARELQLDDSFMQKVLDELDPNGSGDPASRFVRINNEMRRANNRALSDLRLKTEPRFLWSQPFLQQHNSKVESNFADLRSYFYKGKKIDQQVHLGYDLAITSHVGVEASNDGRVVYAAPLGIYGNCIVVDHGYSLQSIYGHLSEIAVHEGDLVKRGQIIGKSGQAGLDGGDHIHFSKQLEGVQNEPREWWAGHWIEDHVTKRIGLGSPN